MRKLSIICIWVFIIVLVLSIFIGIVATVLQFGIGEVASGFSDLLWTCLCIVVLAATVGIKANEKGGGNNG